MNMIGQICYKVLYIVILNHEIKIYYMSTTCFCDIIMIPLQYHSNGGLSIFRSIYLMEAIIMLTKDHWIDRLLFGDQVYLTLDLNWTTGF